MKQIVNHVYGRLALAILIGMGLVLGFTSLVIAQQTILSEQAHLQHGLEEETAVSSTTYRVSKNGNGADGLTWPTAYTDLQDALATATDGDEIWVASGIYTPGISKSDTFTLTPGVGLYGGFATTETERIQRNWETNVTVLSGDIDNDDITDVNGIVTTTTNIVWGNYTNHYNSNNVVTALGITETNQTFTESTVLDGFTITAGLFGTYDNYWSGAGFICKSRGIGHSCSPHLNNIHFSGNWSLEDGGAMYTSSSRGGVSSPTLSNVIFSGNHGDRGGAIAIASGSLIFNKVTFSNNTATHGGAIHNYSWGEESIISLIFNDVTFANNSASRLGGAINNWGKYNSVISATLNNVTFTTNTAVLGGAIYGWGLQGGIYNATFNNALFWGNTARSGGALYNETDGDRHEPESGHGGVVNNILNNVIFSGNSASGSGGAIMMYTNGEKTNHTNLTINNATFANNTANNSGAINIENTSAFEDSSLTLNNTIIWGNTVTDTGNAMKVHNSTITITTSLIQGGINGADILNENATIVDGGGNIANDPLFLRTPNAGDGDWTTLEDNNYGDLSLQSGSPAIDAGTNSAINLPTDLAGNPRIFNGTVDMGAYEVWRDLPFKIFLPQLMR